MLPSLRAQIGILNDCDKPEARLLVIRYGTYARPRVQYLHPHIPPILGRGYVGTFTPTGAFGVSLSFEPDGRLLVTAARASVAKYQDGKPRIWQGFPEQSIEYRAVLAPHVYRCVAFEHASKRAEFADRMGLAA